MAHLTSVERRWRTLAGNNKLPLKLRLLALERMKAPSDRWLCGFIRKLKNSPRLIFAANLRLDQVREETFKRKLLAEYGGQPDPEPQPERVSSLD